MTEKTAQKEPGKKPAPSKKPKPQQEVVVQISLSELHPFPDHPFQVREDASMQETAESVKEYGVLVPALARPREDGGYELIAGTIMKNLPVYKHPAAYAREHDELAVYRASNQANTACKEAIGAAIRDHYRDNRLDAAAVDQVVQQFGYDRTFHVLAITVCQADWDRRYSPDNRAWANAMSIPANPDAWGTDRNCYLAVNSHPGLVDLFLSQTRKAYAQEQQKTSVRDKLKKPPETTSPKISAKSKAPER